MKNVNTNAELKSLANPKHGDAVHVTASQARTALEARGWVFTDDDSI